MESYEDFKPEDIAVTVWPLGQNTGFTHKPVHGVRVIHLPTGTVVTCETERSNHRNLEIALQQLWEQVQGKAAYTELKSQHDYFKNGMAELQDYIDKIEPELLALRAQVEVLRNAAIQALHADDIEDDEDRASVFDKLNDAVLAIPAQCLAEVRAKAGRDGYLQSWEDAESADCRGMVYYHLTGQRKADQYANQLRQAAKGGK